MDDATADDRHLRGDVTDLNLGAGHRIVRRRDDAVAGEADPGDGLPYGPKERGRDRE
jgi:hypothetical protein